MGYVLGLCFTKSLSDVASQWNYHSEGIVGSEDAFPDCAGISLNK